MHPLDGPRLKVRCAQEEIDIFERFEATFIQNSNYEVVRAEFNPKTAKYAYRVLMDILPPPDIGVLIGEVAYNLRSALDALVWQLALLNTDTPAGNTAFPIFLHHTTSKTRTPKSAKGSPPLRPHFRQQGMNMLTSLHPKHKAAIERLQPYKRGGTSRLHVLYLLQEINNADKHRLMQVVSVRPRRYRLRGSPAETSRQQGESLAAAKLRFVVLKDGAKIGEAPASVDVEPKLIPSIAFRHENPSVDRRPVRVTLRRIANHVAEIVEGFGPEFG